VSGSELSKVVKAETDIESLVPLALESLKRRLAHAESRVTRVRLELFQRRSITRRVRREREGHGSEIQHGSEAGIAVRSIDGRGRVGFAAASDRIDPGGSAGDLDTLVEAARVTTCSSTVWNEDAAAQPRIDVDSIDPLPEADALDDWVGRSLTELEERGAAAGAVPVESWIEAGRTVETLVVSGGLATARVRQRVWAMARFRIRGEQGDRERVLFCSGRRMDELDPAGDLGRALPPEPTRGVSTQIDPGMDLVVLPEPAAVLVQAAVHGDPGHPVGLGWRVADEPDGLFDDVGFASTQKLLTDGRKVVGTLGGPGTFRRPSFRDPPVSMPACLRVSGERLAQPPNAVVVAEARIHPMGAGTWLQIGGWSLVDGRVDREIRDAVVPFEPGVWVRRCAGTVGEPRRSHHGVVTPALLFRAQG
jgi:hypothetical protein